jgi:hypothetical protein
VGVTPPPRWTTGTPKAGTGAVEAIRALRAARRGAVRLCRLAESDQRFRRKATTRSGRERPPDPAGSDHLVRLIDPAHPEHDERRDWLGRPFDTEAFDPSEFEDNLRNGRLAVFDDEA